MSRTVTAFGALGVVSVLGIGLLFLLGHFPYYWLLVVFVLCFDVSQESRGPVVSTLCAELFPGGGLRRVGGRVATGRYEAIFLFPAVTALLGLAQFWTIPALARGRHKAAAGRGAAASAEDGKDDREES